MSGTVVVYESGWSKMLKMTYGSAVVWSLQWSLFVGILAKLQYVTLSFVSSVHLSVLLHETTWIPVDRLLRKLIFEYCSKI
jgi:hypothetical protein